MLVCDRCNNQAARTINTFPTRGSTDLCERCYVDLVSILSAFLEATKFSVVAPDVAAEIQISKVADASVLVG